MNSLIRPFLASLAVLLAGAVSSPAAPSGPATAAQVCPADDGVAAPNLRVDQSNSQAEAEVAQQEAIAERANILSSLVEVRHPDGSVSVDLQDAFWSRVIMQRNMDGSTVIRCFPAGAQVVFPLPPAKQPLEEK